MKHHSDTPYTWIDVMMANPHHPMKEATRNSQLTRMWQALSNMEIGERPTVDDWRTVSDAINLLETLVNMGIAEDSQALLPEAIEAMVKASERYTTKGAIRLDARGIFVTRSVLEDYAFLLANVPERRMIQCHITTAKRVRALSRSKNTPHGHTVIAL